MPLKATLFPGFDVNESLLDSIGVYTGTQPENVVLRFSGWAATPLSLASRCTLRNIKQAQPAAGVYAVASGRRKIVTWSSQTGEDQPAAVLLRPPPRRDRDPAGGRGEQ